MYKKRSNKFIIDISKIFGIEFVIITSILILTYLYLSNYINTYFFGISIAFSIILISFTKFESGYISIKNLLLLSSFCSLAVLSRCSFYFIPYIKPFISLIIIFSMFLEPLCAFMLGALSCFVSNMLLGQGPWTIWQALASGIIGTLSSITFRKFKLKPSRLNLFIFSFISVMIIYCPIIDISSLMFYSENLSVITIIGYLSASMPTNIIHLISTIIFTLFIYKKLNVTLPSLLNGV